jgi:hypothetical protein
MKPVVLVATLLSLLTAAYADSAPSVGTPTVRAQPQPEHANPRVKASYRLWSISNLGGGQVWLQGAQLDAYAVSRRWIRFGFELEGGAGSGRADAGNGSSDTTLSMGYGLGGVTAAVQYPARVTPFLEGRFAAGILGGQLDEPFQVGGVTISPSTAITYLYGGGLETGVELYVVGRAYLSIALGWMRTTWRGPDVAARRANPMGGLQTTDLGGDTFTLKAGIGL